MEPENELKPRASAASCVRTGWATRLAVGASAIVLALGAGIAAGCGDDDEGPAEEAGQAVDEAGEEAGQALDEADKEVGEDEE
jgi:hypothetical protein